MNSKKLFSIIIPVYQNERNLGATISKLMELKKELPNYDLELIFVEDGSTDKSYQILLDHYNQFSEQIRIVKHTKNFGQNPAIQSGLRVANGDCIGIISADLQDPHRLFLEMIARWEKGTKLVIAERQERKEKYYHRIISNLYWRMVAKYAIPDFPRGGFDYCLFDKQLKNDLNRINEKNPVMFPLIFWLGYDHEVIFYARQRRTEGKSQWTFLKKLKLTIDTFIAFTYLPVRIITVLGIVISILSFVYSLVIFVKWLHWGISLQGWSTIVILVSMFGGLTLLSLGVIGEYLWRILDESRSRPNSIVDVIIGK